MSNLSNLIGQRLGQYQITALLGRGGMATVYRARQTSMDRDVAIKVIKPDLAELDDFVKRFEREAKTVANLSNAHILKVFDYGREQEIVYLVMELLTGGSLAELIAKGPIEPETASQLLDQIASALDYAHRQGIIHRDLKPQNVLLDADQDAFLTDFGLAKLLNAGTRLTYGSGTMGTPAYMAPEQWQGGVVDARTDIYALGVLLFEMLSGTLPFNGDTPFRMMHMHVYEQPRTLIDLNMDFSPEADKVLRKALAKDREERYGAAGEMAKAFRIAILGPDASKMNRPVSNTVLPSPPSVDRITLLPLTDLSLTDPSTMRLPTPPAPPANIPPVPPASVTPTAITRPTPDDSKKRSLLLPLLIAGIAAIAIVVVIIGVLGSNHTVVDKVVLVATAATPTQTATLTNTIPPTNTAAPTNTIAPTQTTAPTDTVTPLPPTNTVIPTNTIIPTDTPTITFTDTPITPTDTQVATQTAVVDSSPTSTPTRPMITAKQKIYTHSGPSNKYALVTTMQRGDQYPVIGQAISGTAFWYEVALPNQQTAWVFAPNVDLTPPNAPIPIVATPQS